MCLAPMIPRSWPDILVTLGRDAGPVREALDGLAYLAGQPLTALDPARRAPVAMELRANGGAAVATLTSVVKDQPRTMRNGR
jgi:hypothetical protein